MAAKVEAVLPDKFQLGESGFWDSASNSLVFVDIIGKAVCRSHSVPRLHRMNTNVGAYFAIPRSNGKGLVITQTNTLEFMDEATGKCTPFVAGDKFPSGTIINDGKCDAKGRLWLGTFIPKGDIFKERNKWSPESGIYRVTPEGEITQQADGMILSNGLDWTSDNRTMLYVDSLRPAVYAFDFDLECGTLGNRRVAVEWAADQGFIPDGMCVDASDHVWVALMGGSRVAQYDLHTGKEIQRVNLPCKAVTCANFGGSEFQDLYVMTSEAMRLPGMTEAEKAAGEIYKVTGLNVKGKAPHKFAG